ncbi:MAG: hypothetical protein EOP08_03465 [Proteobacteria bacterium]|nr:MAG: hypothetical protein EOP08_03465 [Pseudomonadota bacterium]
MGNDACRPEANQLRVQAARHLLNPALDGSELVDAGVAALLAGDESPEIVELAGMRRDDGPLAIRAMVGRALRRYGAAVESKAEAAMVLTRHALAQFMTENRDAMDTASEIGCYSRWLPADLEAAGRLDVMCATYDELEPRDPRRAEIAHEAFVELAMLAAQLDVA